MEKPNIKPRIHDIDLSEVAEHHDFTRHEFVNVYAVEQSFTKVVFKQCNFSSCYFRKCNFVECDFTGAIFKDSSFIGSQFTNCKLLYTRWEKTIVDEAILESSLPGEENLARDFARALRVNFAQIGSPDGINKAAEIEVAQTGKHLWNAASASSGYYKQKYTGRKRIEKIAKFIWWQILDLLWGNGEKPLRVLIWVFCMPFIFAVILLLSNTSSIATLWPTYLGDCDLAHRVFWGLPTVQGPAIELGFTLPLRVIRYVLFGLFMAILIRRLSRR